MQTRFFAVVILLVTFSTTVNAQSEPPGEIIAVNRHDLHLHCTGEGSPTVILEAGVGGFTLNWTEVQPILAEETRVCSYDRRGYGWSAPLDGPFNLETALDDLTVLLDTANIEPPYIFVAHSFGGVMTRAYIDQYPEEVIGVVFLDVVHPDLPLKVPLYPDALQAQLAQIELFTASLRLFANVQDERFEAMGNFLPDDMSELYLSKVLESKFIEATQAEATYLIEDMPALDLPNTIGDIPFVVISHGIPERGTFLGAPLGLEAAAEAEETWQRLQHDLVNLSPQGILIIAQESQHNIQFEQPDLVIEQVLAMIDAANA
jgi:pimeloyl-ACP methyl ester carboxylesterase